MITPVEDFLTVNFKSKSVEPKKTEQIPICFVPSKAISCSAQIRFFVNSNLHLVTITGEGVVISIELVDHHDKFVNLGNVMTGKHVAKIVKVINNSTAIVSIMFDISDRLPLNFAPAKVVPAEFLETAPPETPKKSPRYLLSIGLALVKCVASCLIR